MNEQWFEKIEDYLSGRMSAEEQLRFEEEMATDKELATDLNVYREIEEEMRDDETHHKEETALKNSLEKLNKIYFPSSDNSIEQMTEPKIYPLRKKIKPWKIISIAAGILGIIALGSILYLNRTKNRAEVAVNKNKVDTSHLQKPAPSQNLAENKDTINETNNSRLPENINPETLYAQNFAPDALPEDTEGALEDAFDAYRNKKYKEAIGAINSADLNAATTRSETDTALIKFYAYYYKAQCFLTTGNAAEAIINLKNALDYCVDNYNKIKVNWYLALAYLKTGRLKLSNDLLTKIAADRDETKYKKQAEALKEKLNNLIP